MLKGYAPGKFVLRYMGLIAAFGVAGIALEYLVLTLAWLTHPMNHGLLWFYQHGIYIRYEPTWWLYLIYSIALPCCIFGLFIFGAGGLVLFGVLVLTGGQIVLKLFVGIAYRLVERKTGVVSATGSVLAVTFGVIEILMRMGAFRDPQAIYKAMMKPTSWFGGFLCISLMLAFQHIEKSRPVYRRWAAAVQLGSMLLALVLCSVGLGADSEYPKGLAPIALFAASLMAVGFLGIGATSYVVQRRTGDAL